MTVFTCLLGEPALPEFRKNRLVNLVNSRFTLKVSVEARFVYLVETARSLDASESDRLNDVLHGVSAAASVYEDAIFIIPRIGTQSPWSTKATDIANRCGIEPIIRVERGTALWISGAEQLDESALQSLYLLLHDRMTQSVVDSISEAKTLFSHGQARPVKRIPILEEGAAALHQADRELGLALSEAEVAYLVDSFSAMERNPTDAELMMFAQANSEHCRHKIFNASWTIDSVNAPLSLFDMIRNTHANAPQGVLSAYHDNSAVIDGAVGDRFLVETGSGAYHWQRESLPFQIKVETHNHPTAISPFAGAATGSGGEIRDEAATGRGARPKAGLTGFSVSHLDIPGYQFPWLVDYGKPDRIASSLDIMIEGPIGGAAFNNEFGRPALCGYFRTFTQEVGGAIWGYHKPIMLAGGYGTIRKSQVDKLPLKAGCKIVVLGGPAMLIGLGGGAASSVGSGQSQEDLDYASVQRGNPEMQRRCQEVIDACWSMDDDNPILSLHDVGAGGLSNALPELLNDGGVGGELELREVQSMDSSMSPMEIWCNEAQERYVLALESKRLEEFAQLCSRERCPFVVIGTATEERQLKLSDRVFGHHVVDMPLSVLLGKTPAMHRDVQGQEYHSADLDLSQIDFSEELRNVLRFPAVGSKSFLITIGDRSVGGLVTRDQMVGPWQVPVADAAVTLGGFRCDFGEAMAVGERSPLAIVNGPASGRMAVAEAVTNIASAAIEKISDIRLSANWMAAAGEKGQDSVLFDTVKAIGMELCPDLDIAIPVGKDSLSLKTEWVDDGVNKKICAPVTLIVTAFAPVSDVNRSLTPELNLEGGESRLLLIDLGQGQNRMGGSVIAQIHQKLGNETPDLDSAILLRRFFAAIQELNMAGLIQAYHDRSDGGLISTLCEMAFASHCGIQVQLDVDSQQLASACFSEELGAVIQVIESDMAAVFDILEKHQISELSSDIGRPHEGEQFQLSCGNAEILNESLPSLQAAWSETSHAIQRLRDNPQCADIELAFVCDWSRPAMEPSLGFEPLARPASAMISTAPKPAVAILREQGVNGHVEMAVAFDNAGFESVDVHMSDLIEGRQDLNRFQGFVACGGFSYGDVLGAGRGWAKSILLADEMRALFSQYLARTDRFALGVCNGCQMLSALREIIPGTSAWPNFVHNQSEQFEARLSLVEIGDSPSLFFTGMQGSRIPVATAHGEGRVSFTNGSGDMPNSSDLIALRYVDSRGQATEQYPENPNGSPGGITGMCNEDGRVTILMPHPERTLRTVNFSWAPKEWPPVSPWQQMFHNARQWTG